MTALENLGSRMVSVATSRRPVSERWLGDWAGASAAAVTTSSAARSSAVTARLLLEQVVEGSADVAGARRVRRGVALDRDAQRERGAVVLGVLVGDSLGHRLGAFDASARLEVRALPAGVERRSAIGTLLQRRVRDRQDGAAGAAPRDRALGEHVAAAGRVGRSRRWR